jgi:hypothetical protein
VLSDNPTKRAANLAVITLGMSAMKKPFDANPGTEKHCQHGDLLRKIRKGRGGQDWLALGQN